MTIAEFALDEETVSNILDRVTYLTKNGMTRDEAVSRVVAEVQSFAGVISSAEFAQSEMTLQYRLRTGEWGEPMTKEDVFTKYLPS
jgi:hypothetical protein